MPNPPDDIHPGDAAPRVGAFTIERELGRGGMGTVLLAWRREGGFMQRVAVKVIHGVAGDTQAADRLREERRILAGLNHPSIAHFVDGGSTADGQPYLAMEFVEGEPIIAYCDGHRLAPEARVRVFLRVCEAVQFAHQRLIVHRDIKPSNILVTADGTPKLLDFGIAKLLDPLQAAGGATAQVLTPFYASPEQAAGAPVTTSTDVYSLGVLLYELLTGSGPYRSVTPDSAPLAVLDAIRHEAPERPRAAASRAGRPLSEDLEAVVLKALRKEEADRYGSVSQLTEDLTRYLDGLPVRAHDGSRAYVARKFVARHRWAVAAGLIAVLSLSTAIVVSRWQAQVALRERTRADARFNDVRKLANAVVGPLYDAVAEIPGSTETRRALIKEALTYLDSLSSQSAGDVDLKAELAAAYEKIGDVQGNPRTSSLGDVAGATASYAKNLALRREVAAARPADQSAHFSLAQAEARVGDLAWGGNQLEEALTQYREALAVLAAAPGGPSDARSALEARFLARTGETLTRMPRRGDEAAAEFERAIAVVTPVASKTDAPPAAQRSLMAGYASLGDLRFYQGRFEEALAHFEAATTLARRTYAQTPNLVSKRQLSLTTSRVGEALEQLGRLDESLKFKLESHVLGEELAGVDPNDVTMKEDMAIDHSMLASLYLKQGKLETAVREVEQSLEIWKAVHAANPDKRAEDFQYAQSLLVVGRVEVARRRLPAAVEMFRQAVMVFSSPNLDARSQSDRFDAYEGLGDALSAQAAATGSAALAAEAKAAYTTARDGYRSLDASGDLPAARAGRAAELDKKIAR